MISLLNELHLYSLHYALQLRESMQHKVAMSRFRARFPVKEQLADSKFDSADASFDNKLGRGRNQIVIIVGSRNG